MAECHTTSTLVDTRVDLSSTDDTPTADPITYRSLVGALQYLMLTRPDLACCISSMSLYV
jgi:hypothetical protein